MAEKKTQIPILDCESIGLNAAEGTITNDTFKDFGEQFVSALTSHGLLYLKNHGIDTKVLEEYMTVSRKFFALPVEKKEPITRVSNKAFGWFPYGIEKLYTKGPADMKEAFNYCPRDEEGFDGEWPDAEFEQGTKNMFESCVSLTKRLFDALSLGLGLDKSFMDSAHKEIGKHGNQTNLRTQLYFPIFGNTSVEPGQIRCGEHTDFGSFTLLYQDDVGGLEIDHPTRGYEQAPPIPNTLVVFPASLLQRWTSDSIIATKHKVIIPEAECQREVGRQSMAFFINPDDDVEIKPLDGSDKYEVVTTADYFQKRVDEVVTTAEYA